MNILNRKSSTQIVAELVEGISAAYTSDAGTPGLSDPGGKLVALAAEKGVETIPIPGTVRARSRCIRLWISDESVFFLGFPPTKKHRSFFSIKSPATSLRVFYESTHRILKTLEELRKRLSANRKIFIGRELTKMHEQIYRGYDLRSYRSTNKVIAKRGVCNRCWAGKSLNKIAHVAQRPRNDMIMKSFL